MDAGRRGQSCRTHCRGTASWHHADGASAKQLERHMQQPLAAEKQGGDLCWAHRDPSKGCQRQHGEHKQPDQSDAKLPACIEPATDRGDIAELRQTRPMLAD